VVKRGTGNTFLTESEIELLSAPYFICVLFLFLFYFYVQRGRVGAAARAQNKYIKKKTIMNLTNYLIYENDFTILKSLLQMR